MYLNVTFIATGNGVLPQYLHLLQKLCRSILRHSQVHFSHAHGKQSVGVAAKGLPIDEIAPAANRLSDQKAQCHQIQQCRQVDFFDFAVQDHANRRTDYCTVDGQSAAADIDDFLQVAAVIVPLRKYIVQSGADHRHRHNPQHTV